MVDPHGTHLYKIRGRPTTSSHHLAGKHTSPLLSYFQTDIDTDTALFCGQFIKENDLLRHEVTGVAYSVD